MTKIGKFWTGAVAYVSLLVGAGLSVAGNLADTYRTRGVDVDTLDKVMAAAWPILVLLAVHMFVSPHWSEKTIFQVWRWVGVLAVGGMAMVVSWTHLHDLMASRGQLYVVSVLGPLAIDGMAIMATGLILSTRVLVQVATHGLADIFTAVATDNRPAVATATDNRPDAATWPRTPDVDDGHGHPADECADTDIVATRPQGDYDAWERGYEDALRVTGQEVATEAERWLSAMSVATDSLPRRPRTSGAVPAEFVAMATAWDPDFSELSRADMIKLSAAHFDVSTRTVRRWLSAVTGQPMSGA